MADGKKGIVEGAGEAAADAAGAGVAAARGALGAVGGLIGGLADKAGDAAAGAADAARAAVGEATAAVGEVAGKAGEAASDALDAVTGAASALADRAGDVAGDAVDAVRDAAGAASGAAGAVGAAVAGGAAAVAGALTGQSGGGGSVASGGAGGARAGSFGAAGGDDDGGSLIGAALPVLLGAAGAALLAWGGMHLLNNKWTVPPVPETAVPAAPSPTAPAGLAWLAGVGDGLKGQFPWLTLAAGSAGSTVIASGEAADAAGKSAALDAAGAAIAAVPEAAGALLIDNITVAGSTDAPVGAALAGLGTGPDVAACGKAFSDTMAGRTINFTTGSAVISVGSARLLDALTAIGTACAAHTISIEGHTDTVGNPDSNQALSQARASAVKSYWESKGLTSATITATGFGESQPLVATPDETPSEQNRRIEFKVTAAP